MKTQNSTCPKKSYQKVTYEHKLFVIDQIKNGQISVNYASKKYDISRSSINYWIKKYATFEQNNKGMSMTEQYDPYENAIAERINRTLKYEYGLKQCIKNTKLAEKMTHQAVGIYNNLRPHLSLELRKPTEVHNNPTIKYKSYKRNKKQLTELLF